MGVYFLCSKGADQLVVIAQLICTFVSHMQKTGFLKTWLGLTKDLSHCYANDFFFLLFYTV